MDHMMKILRSLQRLQASLQDLTARDAANVVWSLATLEAKQAGCRTWIGAPVPAGVGRDGSLGEVEGGV